MLILDRISQARSTSTIASKISLLSSGLVLASSSANEMTDQSDVIAADTDMTPNDYTALHFEQRQVTRISPCHRTLFGTFSYRTTLSYKRSRGKDTATSCSYSDSSETVFTFIPSFFGRCIEWRLSNYRGRISYSLTTYVVVENNSPLFVACREGDLNALKSILSLQDASPFVVNESGNTPLHVKPRKDCSISGPAGSLSHRRLLAIFTQTFASS